MLKNRIIKLGLLIFLMQNLLACVVPSKIKPGLGIWVEAQGKYPIYSSQENFDQMLDDVHALKANHIYLQVYRAGKSWFPSHFADSGPSKDLGFDPISLAIDKAHKRGQQVFAWINLFNLADNLDATILKRLGTGVLIKDNFMRSLEAYNKGFAPQGDFTIGGQEYWIDPAEPKVKLYLVALISELLKQYPKLDGIHLDYVRYPYALPIRPGSSLGIGMDYGYGSIDRFVKESSLPQSSFVQDSKSGLKPASYSIALKWDEWRRQQINSYLRELKKILASWQKLSVAAIAWSDRAYLSAYQDWRLWLEDGLVDEVCLMAYTKDQKHFTQLIKQSAAFASSRAKLNSGIGAWLLETQQLNEQIKIANQHSSGAVLFSYGNLKAGALEFDFTNSSLN